VKFYPQEKGQGLVEYALILIFIALVVIVVLTIFGPALGNIFSNVLNELDRL
jgi:pilus assembly protein Flp/PilA